MEAIDMTLYAQMTTDAGVSCEAGEIEHYARAYGAEVRFDRREGEAVVTCVLGFAWKARQLSSS